MISYFYFTPFRTSNLQNEKANIFSSFKAVIRDNYRDKLSLYLNISIILNLSQRPYG